MVAASAVGPAAVVADVVTGHDYLALVRKSDFGPYEVIVGQRCTCDQPSLEMG